jgi:hypothetical protein
MSFRLCTGFSATRLSGPAELAWDGARHLLAAHRSHAQRRGVVVSTARQAAMLAFVRLPY